MKDKQEPLRAIQDIRHMMQQSTRFLSLSGLSGVLAGGYALAGAYFGHQVLREYVSHPAYGNRESYFKAIEKCAVICLLVLGASILTALILSKRKAGRNGEKLFDRTALRLLVNMMIPLAAGGIFCMALIAEGPATLGFVAPGMLIFYGLALVNSSKYTLHDIRYLGCFEIVLGLIASFYVSHGILFWALGFGILHIIYGSIMWFKYDRGN